MGAIERWVYLDHNATAPVKPEVIVAISEALAKSLKGLTGAATQLTVTPPSALLTFIQDTAHLAAVARDAFGNVVPVVVTWSSTNESVATVGANGVVTATGNGTGSIVAQAGPRCRRTTQVASPAPCPSRRPSRSFSSSKR